MVVSSSTRRCVNSKGVWGQNVVNNWLKPHPSPLYAKGIFSNFQNYFAATIL